MANTVLIGSQWGDEGKGKVIDVLTRDVDMVVRFQGGNNAGHTVKIGDDTHVLHLLPSGIFHAGKICVVGNGVVVDPVALLEEIRLVGEKGIDCAGRLFVSDRAHVVFPHHRALDAAREAVRSAGRKIGTTKRGIGPAYGEKVSRTGLRMIDLADASFADRLRENIREANGVLQALDAERLDEEEIVAQSLAVAAQVTPWVADTVSLVNGAVREGRSVLFEGAQGTMLDIDFGSYPFVTSSNASAGGVCSGTGVAPHRIDRVVGVVKAYTTRVGEGPFPTELDDEAGRHMRSVGAEFGATTGRPRRCGWFDAVIARYSAMINGVDRWAMTKLDVLDKLETIKIAVAYQCDGRRYDTVPAGIDAFARCVPVYEEMPGWMADTRQVERMEDLPPRARDYVERLCEITGVKLGLLSVGPGRDSTILVDL
jgi:adenylosuccinate synthase